MNTERVRKILSRPEVFRRPSMEPRTITELAAALAVEHRETDLAETDLRWADLRGACLIGAHLVEARLQGADLRRTDLREANLARARLTGAVVRDAMFQDVTGLTSEQVAYLRANGAVELPHQLTVWTP